MQKPDEIMNDAKKYAPDIIEWRRDIHAHPEIGFDLPRTSEKVAGLLKEFGYEVKTGFARSAVLGILDTGKPGRTIAVRADMDALGMQEQTDLPYKSETDGACHACGHDSHTAMLLGLAKYLSEHKEHLKGGKIKLIFQPAEEGPVPGGAKLVVDSGVLDDVDAMFGAHAQPLYNAGHVGCKYGDAFASGDFFEVKLTGPGCHAASPHKGKDLITTAAEMVSAIQNIRTREVPPLKTAVISICSINSGKLETKNVLPAELTFGGTFRTYDDEVREYIAKRIGEVVEKIADMNGVKAEYTESFNFPYFRNDDDIIDTIYHSAIEVLGPDKVIKKPDPEMGSEDFAWYTKKYKAAFFFFGIRNEEKDCVYSLHSPKFKIDEDTFAPTLAVYVNTVYHLLEDDNIYEGE